MTDSGQADPRLTAALDSGPGVLAAFTDARVFAGISATSTAEHTTEHGLRAESSAEMAVLLLEVDGARALPVFTDINQLKRWDLSARPVPLTGREACQAALDEGAEAVVLDFRVTFGLADVRSMASGWVPVAGSSLASRVGETRLKAPGDVPDGLVDALVAALRDEPLRSARLLEGPDGLVVGVCPRRPLGPADLAALAQRLMTALGPALPAEGLDLTVVDRRGPGLPLIKPKRFRR